MPCPFIVGGTMAYAVNFGIIDKKVNSTAQGFTVNHSASCVLKEPSDVLNPTFTYQGAFNEKNNYFYVADFGRYYWITSTTFVLGHWEITGKVDVLASFKTEIGASQQIVARSELLKDDKIIDTEIPILAKPMPAGPYTWAVNFDLVGSYIICVAGKNGNKFYILGKSAWEGLCARVYNSTFLTDYKNIWQSLVTDLQNIVLRPQDYIIRSLWVPFAVPQGAQSAIALGFTETDIGGFVASPSFVWTGEYNLTIPDHPQLATYGDFVNSNIYRKLNLFLPGYGNIALDSDALSGTAFLQVKSACDLSGNLYYSVNCGGVVTCVSCNIGVDIGYNVTRANVGTALASVEGSAADILSGNLLGAAAGIGSAVGSMLPHVEHASGGASAGVPAATPNIVLSGLFYMLDSLKLTRQGRAYNKMLQINATSGYLQCVNASVACPGTQSEIEEINAFLNGGFYYE